MKGIVVPISDARDAEWAVPRVIEQYRKEPVNVYLLNVRHPLPRHVTRFFKASGGLNDVYREAGMEVLAPTIKALDDAGIPHEDHVLVGHKAETIVRFAQRHDSDVVLDNKSYSVLSLFGLGSIAGRVHRLMHPGASPRASNLT